MATSQSAANQDRLPVSVPWSPLGMPWLPKPSLLWNRTVALVGVLVLLYTLNLLTFLLGDYWLLQELGLESVFWTNFRMGAMLYVVALIVFAAAAILPVLAHEAGPSGRAWAISPGFLLATVFALALSLQYETFLLGTQDVGFGETEPVFGKDLGFYVFDLPYMWQIWTFAFLAALVALGFALLASVAQARRRGLLATSRPAMPIAIGYLATFPVRLTIAIVGIVGAIGVWLSRYGLLTKDNYSSSVYVGADYVDVTGLLSNLNFIYVSVALVLGATGILVIILARLHRVATAGGAPEVRLLWLGLAALVGIHFAFKGGVELRDALLVKPNEPVIQLEFIERHIQATRTGAKLEGIERIDYAPASPSDPLPPIEELLDSSAMRNLPLWPGFSSYLERLLDPQHADRILLTRGDHMVYGPTLEYVQQAQKLRAYYRFMGVDFARYTIDGEQRMVVSGVRELPLYEPEPWLGYFGQRYMLFTHGFGMAIAPANEVTPQHGLNFVTYNIPGQFKWPELALENERVYYGEGSATMAFSNVDRMLELDFPTERDRAQIFLAEGETTAITVDSFLKRLVIGWRSGHFVDFLFSNLISGETRVHYYRQPIERLQRVAPFLFYDTNPYAVVSDGGIRWIVNGMTTSRSFPYSRYGQLGDKSDQRSAYPVEHRWINYVEDSVKAVVDAYSGEVALYRMSDDPVIQTWASIYPDLFRDIGEMPPSLRAQLTYPVQLLHYQMDDLWIYYHMEDPMYFFNLEDMWDDADEVLGPIVADGQAIRFSIEPYPLIVDTGELLPAASQATQYASLMVFTPEKALNLRGIPLVYQDGPEYGTLAVLEVPKGRYVMGPEQADAMIDQDPRISSQFALWTRLGMDVIRGHTITVPLSGEVIYVEPIFLRSRQNPVTQLRKVAVVFREQVAMADSVEEALREIYHRLGGKVGEIATPVSGAGDFAHDLPEMVMEAMR